MAEEIDKCFEVAKKTVLHAGEKLKAALNETEENTDDDIKNRIEQLQIDMESILITGLTSNFPDHKFISEKICDINGEQELTDSPTWMINPLDGTTNSIHGFPYTSVSVSLTINKQVMLGIIFNPYTDELFTAKRGHGAYINGKQLKVSSAMKLQSSLIIFDPIILGMPKMRDIILERIYALAQATSGIRNVGSAVLAMTYVAKGIIDAFQMDYLKPWDVAVGLLFVEEAGGVVIDTKGGTLDIMKPKIIAAASESLAREMSRLIIDTDLQTQRKRLKKT